MLDIPVVVFSLQTSGEDSELVFGTVHCDPNLKRYKLINLSVQKRQFVCLLIICDLDRVFPIYLFVYFEGQPEMNSSKTFHHVIFFRACIELKTDRCFHLAACHSSSAALNPTAEGQI